MARINLDELRKSCHAVVVGVGQFETTGLQLLPAPEREAREISAALTDPKGCCIPPVQVCTLTAGAATRLAIYEALRRAATKTSSRDTLMFYFSGHGHKLDREFLLCPFDYKVDDNLRSGLSGRDIADLLSISAARGVLVILDCCVSAGFAERAPDFFRSLGNADFRILLSASRENQKSWETVDGKGTLFSAHLISLLTGEAPASTTPGHITFSGLLEAIDFGVKTDLAGRPSIPPQDPVFAGVYSRDPLLFVHGEALLSGISVDTERITRAQFYRVIRKLLITISASLVFAVGTYVAWLNAHEYAEVRGSNISLYRGYPGLPWFGFPQLLRELSYGPQEMAEGSALRTGEAIVAPMGKPVMPLVLENLSLEIKSLRAVSLGDVETARRIILPIIAEGPGIGGATSESLLVVSMVLPDIVQNLDINLLPALFRSDHMEVRTKALQALLKLAPNEGLERAIKDAVSRRDFEHIDILRELEISCRPELVTYFSTLLSARDALNIVGSVLDASMRLDCPLSSAGLLAAARAVPRDKTWDVVNYAQVEKVADLNAALATSGDRDDPFIAERFSILQVGLNIAQCPRDKLSPSKDNSARFLELELLLRACKDVYIKYVPASGKRPTQIVITKPNEPDQKIDLDIPKLDYFSGEAWLHLITNVGFSNSTNAVIDLAEKASDPNLNAKAVDELKTRKIAFGDLGSIPFGNSVTLRRALIAWQADTEPSKVAKYLLDRLSDQEMFDVEQLFGLVIPTNDQMRELKRFLPSGGTVSDRAVAILAMHAETQDAADLLMNPQQKASETAWEYVGNNPVLDDICKALAKDDPIVARSVMQLARSRAALAVEMGKVSQEMRRWRAEFLLQNRRSATSNPGQLLTPGITIWLRRTYGVTGDAGL